MTMQIGALFVVGIVCYVGMKITLNDRINYRVHALAATRRSEGAANQFRKASQI